MERRYLIKGAFFALTSGFIIYAVPVLLQTPYLTYFPLTNVLSNHFGGVIWGVATAQTLRWLDRTPAPES
jgi:hypothetical protein